MNKSEYFKLVAKWAQKYGVPNRAFRYDPSEVRVTCVKCNQIRAKMARHHKCNDFFFALHWPDLFAARYVLFDRSDIVKLCEKCHKSIERYSQPLKDELYVEFEHFFCREEGIIYSDTFIREWAAEWKTKFNSHYEKWLKKPIRKKHRKVKHGS